MNLNSTVRFTADGTVDVVDLTYDVLQGDEVQVFFGDTRMLTGWALQASTQPQRVQFDEVIPAGTQVLIRRYTDMRDVPHVFHFTGNGRGGAEFNSRNMDENFDKIKRASQDAMDSFELIGVNIEAALDAKEYADQAEVSKNQAALSASQANTSRTQAQTAAATATSKAGEATSAASTATTKAQEALSSQTAAEGAELAAESYASTASTKAGEASVSANTASNAATTATTRANQATGAATTAVNAKDAAADSANAAADSENMAFLHSNAAYTHVLKARDWAALDVDVPVEAGEYSARHWAIKAAEVVQGDATVNVQDSPTINFSGSGSITTPLVANVTSVGWDLLTDIPATFPPATHTHSYTDLEDIPTTFPPEAHTHEWESITDKPSTYPATAHTHPWTAITAKPATYPTTWLEVDAKPSTFPPESHTHTWGSITNKPTSYPTTWSEVGDKPTTYAPSSHTHPWGQVTGKPSTFPPSLHEHSWNDITQKPVSFLPAPHTHSHTQITGLGSAAQLNVGWEGDQIPYVGSIPTRSGSVLDMPVGSKGTWETDENNSRIFGFPTLSASLSTPRCWIAECFGTSNRRVLRVTEIFGQAGSHRGATYVRVLHDTTWHDWIKLQVL